jgi:hypothetical protein
MTVSQVGGRVELHYLQIASCAAPSGPWSRGWPLHPVIVWYLLADPTVHYQDLGPGFYAPTSTPSAPSATTSASWKRSATSFAIRAALAVSFVVAARLLPRQRLRDDTSPAETLR